MLNAEIINGENVILQNIEQMGCYETAPRSPHWDMARRTVVRGVWTAYISSNACRSTTRPSNAAY